MNTIQKLFDKHIEQSFKLEVLGPEFVKKRLNELGIDLSKTQYNEIKNQFKNLDKNGLHFEFEDDQVIKAGFKSEKEFRAALKSLPDDLVNDLEKFTTDYLDNLPETFKAISEEISIVLLNSLERKSNKMLKARRKDFSRFESHLRKSWKKAFDLFEMLIAIALEVGEDYNCEFRGMASEKDDLVFEVLTRLHARACQIASEIMVLLQSGYADGAHARWRSLHEVVVVGLLISSHDNTLAEKYLLYDTIESYKASLIYQEHCEKLGYDPLTDDELNELKQEYDLLINRFGTIFKKEYGWAYPTIDSKNPTFRDIEKAVGLKHLRPYYKMACHNVHANPRGIFFKLGLYPDSGDILLAGPSNIGLADPAHSAALSLAQITISLLTHNPNLDRLVICQIIFKLQDEIGAAFLDTTTSIYSEQAYNNVLDSN